ncbi:hypothetical protein A1704_23095 [Chryseobacterium cucumeris]|nr:hypothetical protein A1704_23095 [Chryseobacterium cucumeris]
MENIHQRKILKLIFFILVISIFQPFFDIFLLFQYGQAANYIDYFIIQQTFYIFILYIAVPLIILYTLLKIISWNSLIKYSIIGIPFAVSFYKITLLLFQDRVAAWSTFSYAELFSSALIASSQTLLFQIVVTTAVLYKINLENRG